MGAGGAADFVDLFDLFRRNGPPPQDLARAPIDAQGGELLVRPIELRQENASLPNDGRRQSGPHSRFPKNVLAGAKVNGRFAFAESRGIRSSKLGPPRFAAVLRRACEARRQDDGYQKSDRKSSSHGESEHAVYKLKGGALTPVRFR